jgi:hypothetical protein
MKRKTLAEPLRPEIRQFSIEEFPDTENNNKYPIPKTIRLSSEMNAKLNRLEAIHGKCPTKTIRYIIEQVFKNLPL